MSDNQKPLKDWTLGEAKEHCQSQEECSGCPFFNKLNENGDPCLFDLMPNEWILSEKPKYSKEDIEKLKAIKVLYPDALIIRNDFGGISFTMYGIRYLIPTSLTSIEKCKAITIDEVLESEG